MVLNDLVDSFCYSQKNAGLKGLKVTHPFKYADWQEVKPTATSKTQYSPTAPVIRLLHRAVSLPEP